MKFRVGKRLLAPALAIVVLVAASSYKSDFFEIAKQIEIFTTLFKELNMNYVDETNPAELMDSAIKNMLEELDPYTKFLNEQDVEAYKINNAGEYSGIGALVRSFKDKLLIVEPYKGYPADLAGLKAGDEIIKIGDQDIADFEDDATELLKGANNSSVKVTYRRQGAIAETSITRMGIEIDAVPYYQMVDDKTGYIVLARFNSKASSQTKAALNSLKDQGAERIILDLRDNPGGLLSEAINVTNLFVPKGELVVTTKSKVKKFNREYKTRSSALDEDIPLVVLVNGSSASASEIVSGSLQDLDRAVILGARSFGKGLVQRPLKLTYGTQLKVTISRYYTASGRCIQSLDYWNRDEAGNAVRNTEFRDFSTRNGRKVQDGGGVMPDIVIQELLSDDIVMALKAQHVLFDFATDYYYANPSAPDLGFSLSEASFEEFLRSVSAKGFTYETATETALRKALAKDDGALVTADVRANYNALLESIQEGKMEAITSQGPALKKALEDEIVKRYYYREGLYDHYLKRDEAILAASQLLADSEKYKSILQ